MGFVQVQGLNHAPLAGAAQRSCGISTTGSAQALFGRSREHPHLVRPALRRELRFQRSCPTSAILCLWPCANHVRDKVWVPHLGNEGWLQAEGGEVWFRPPWSGHCWEQDWEQMCSAKRPQIRNGQRDINVCTVHTVRSWTWRLPYPSIPISTGELYQWPEQGKIDTWHIPPEDQDRTGPSAAKYKFFLQTPAARIHWYLPRAILQRYFHSLLYSLQSGTRYNGVIYSKSNVWSRRLNILWHAIVRMGTVLQKSD